MMRFEEFQWGVVTEFLVVLVWRQQYSHALFILLLF